MLLLHSSLTAPPTLFFPLLPSLCLWAALDPHCPMCRCPLALWRFGSSSSQLANAGSPQQHIHCQKQPENGPVWHSLRSDQCQQNKPSVPVACVAREPGQKCQSRSPQAKKPISCQLPCVPKEMADSTRKGNQISSLPMLFVESFPSWTSFVRYHKYLTSSAWDVWSYLRMQSGYHFGRVLRFCPSQF